MEKEKKDFEDFKKITQEKIAAVIAFFTENEWSFMVDSFNGVVIDKDQTTHEMILNEFSDSIEYNKLDIKWNISKEDLFNKINQLKDVDILIYRIYHILDLYELESKYN